MLQLQAALKQHSETTAIVDVGSLPMRFLRHAQHSVGVGCCQGRMLTTLSPSLLEKMGFSDSVVREAILVPTCLRT